MRSQRVMNTNSWPSLGRRLLNLRLIMKIQNKKHGALVLLLFATPFLGFERAGGASEASVSALGDESTAALFMEGLIEPWQDLSIGIGVDGILDSVSVERGDSIKAGDEIASLESSVEEASLESAEVRARLAKLRADRSRQLHERGAVTQQELDEAAAEAELGALNVKIAAASLARMTVKSPVDGVVMERHVSPGELVSRTSGGVLVRLAQIDPLKIDVIAPLSMYGKIKRGQVAMITPEEPIGGSYEAKVYVVDPLVDAGSGTFRIRLSLSNPDGAIPSGVRCRVQF